MLLIRFSRNGMLLIRSKEKIRLQIRCSGKGMLLIKFSWNRMLLIRCKEKIRLQIRCSGKRMLLIRFSRNGMLLIRCKENLKIRCFGREGLLINTLQESDYMNRKCSWVWLLRER